MEQKHDSLQLHEKKIDFNVSVLQVVIYNKKIQTLQNLKDSLIFNIIRHDPNIQIIDGISAFAYFVQENQYENIELILNDVMKRNPKMLICGKTALDWILKYKKYFKMYNKKAYIDEIELKKK
eukprot:170340_1